MNQAMFELPPREFKAATWNVFHGTKDKVLSPILKRLLRDGVSFFLMQEAGGNDITRLLYDFGLRTFVYDQWRLAWAPEVWSADRVWEHQLSKTPWGEHDEHQSWMALGRFQNRRCHEKLKAGTYHTPSHVQKPEWNKNAPDRWQALHESMDELIRVAKRSRVDHLLFGGDDNVDEGKGPTARWEFMTDTGPLRQIRAPGPTHGKDRRIDDFRVGGLEKAGRGSVRNGGGDHKVFVQPFRFPDAA